ncbi:hypothetical protein L202_08422 [Cryptococcus amylolentus CBS 6039]|uniref:Uncharacterized protein n=2 Tax=Cryptococcus amylolentus TaxID=104669 RepID=A0A1E3H9L6_9TREE|nr:hypothetical protein L202_08422 [Cryptococcus amylolentus CBS 6039]ODN73027.1 hypothetical protein L202_08422 [Cryptococcus amylolentus CBS 6039]ODN98179.1 hypothetical protein I350_07825 [Cryptococcus amylolentus CBS 6273]
MSQDLSRFPPNSRLRNTDNSSSVGHMCYDPTHLDLSKPRESVADWVGSGKSLLPGQAVSLVTFEDGTSTLMCAGCGLNAAIVAVDDREPEKGEQIFGTVTREDMETAGIYEDYRNTFREAASIKVGAVIHPNGELFSWTMENPVFEVDKDSFKDGASLASAFREYDQRHPIDPLRGVIAQAMATHYEEMTNQYDKHRDEMINRHDG